MDVLGWLGAAALVGAYGMTSAGRLRSTGAPFQVLNTLGALALALNTAYHGAWPSTALNAVWLVIGIVALGRLAATRERRAQEAAGGTPAQAVGVPVTDGPGAPGR